MSEQNPEPVWLGVILIHLACPRRLLHRTYLPESAIGPKQTSLVAVHMSAFRGKADMKLKAHGGREKGLRERKINRRRPAQIKNHNIAGASP